MDRKSVRTYKGNVPRGENDTTGRGTCGGNQCPDSMPPVASYVYPRYRVCTRKRISTNIVETFVFKETYCEYKHMHCKKGRNLCKCSADLVGLHVTRIFTKTMICELPKIMHADDDFRNGFNV